MKKYLITMWLMIMGFFCWHAGMAQDSITVSDSATLSFNWLSLIIDNWAYISAIAFYVIYRIVPTAKADKIKLIVDWIWNLIPDRKKGGGVH